MNNRDILSELNDAQREAAACTEGPVMIIAGAGSGKTRTLTYRIAHLVEQGVDPFRILALTFTNKAAAEMKERITKLVGNEARNLWMGTFHSVFAKVLRSEATRLGYTSSFTIYDTDDSKSAVKHIVRELNLDAKTYSPSTVIGRISMAKSSLISPDDYADNPELQQADTTARRPMMADIYRRYNQRLRNSNAMDFDDLLFNMNLLLRDFPEVLLKYQERFRYILVDEYQDTNYSQYLIVKKLAARYQNICVVGDDAQSIYAFRGANIQNIFNFKRDYPSLHLFKLEQNYRSTQNIVNAANSIIANNKEQIQKEIWTDNAVGGKIRLLHASDERDEGNQVAASIRNARLDNNLDYKDFAILYRTNIQSRAIEEALRRAAVPYRVYQGLSFYGRREVKDVLAYLRLVINNHDDEAMLRVINYPSRGIGQTTMDRIRLAAAENEVSICTVLENLPDFNLGISGGIAARINQFLLMIKRFSAEMPGTDAFTIAQQIVLQSGIVRSLQEDDDPDNANRIENIEELLNGIKEFCEKEDQFEEYPSDGDTPDTEPRTLDRFLQQVLLLTSEDKGDDKDADKVSLMTIHSAKGLEFPHVYVVGMEENLFPSMLSLTSRQELEEERRLFYVAVTRAEQQLTLSYTSMRYQYGSASSQEMSRFVEEIDERYIEIPRRHSSFPPVGELPRTFFTAGRPAPDKRKLRPLTPVNKASVPSQPNSNEEIRRFQVGTKVSHKLFGIGRITAIDGPSDAPQAVIHFEQAGEKRLVLRFAKLSIVE
ncbi:MAG: DNA helicase II / ATP-dependent DNA helicase PcrA [bacterium P3]|nr:MAG: DNA helicase II / ATP-dependent DNA helicase PcrA [bacterium P3]KWW40768.1 MAG: DNA helicase II / ATP-dependent DNA helicase PcrA [bacterium F083]